MSLKTMNNVSLVESPTDIKEIPMTETRHTSKLKCVVWGVKETICYSSKSIFHLFPVNKASGYVPIMAHDCLQSRLLFLPSLAAGYGHVI